MALDEGGITRTRFRFRRGVIAAPLFVLAVPLPLAPKLLDSFLAYNVRQNHAYIDSLALAAAQNQSAILDLAKLLQSDPIVIEAVNEDWPQTHLPESWKRIHPEFIHVYDKSSCAIWGNGFFHARLNVEIVVKPGDAKHRSWELWFSNDAGDSKLLKTFDMPTGEQFKLEDLGFTPADR